MGFREFLQAQARHFSHADTPWLEAGSRSRQRNPRISRPTVDHYWTGEPIEVPSDRSKWPANGFVIYRGPSMLDDAPIICVASGFVDPTTNEKTGDMIQTWIMREDVDPQQAVWSGADSSICGDCVHRGVVGQHRDRPYVGKRSEQSLMTPGLVFKEGGVPSKRKIMMPKSVGRSCYVIVSQAPLDKWKQFHRGDFPVVELGDLPALFQGAFPVRIGSYGDPVAVPVEVWRNVLRHQVCWTGYTSQWMCEENQVYKDFLMASVSSPEEMQAAHRLGWRTFRIGRKNEPLIAGVEIVCPATAEGGFRTQCDSCNLCMGLSRSGAKSIVTAPHGGGAKHHEARGRALPMIDPERRRNAVKRSRGRNYMTVTSKGVGLPLIVVRTPWPMPRWKDIVTAMTDVMREHGARAKDFGALDGLVTISDDVALSADKARFAERVEAAYRGEPDKLPAFRLYDWKDGEFVLVREATKQPNRATRRSVRSGMRRGSHDTGSAHDLSPKELRRDAPHASATRSGGAEPRQRRGSRQGLRARQLVG